MLGDLGGVTEVIMITFGFLLFPISEHSFIVDATKKLYLAKTVNNDLFHGGDKLDISKMIKTKNPKCACISKKDHNKYENNRLITVDLKQNIRLFYDNFIQNVGGGWLYCSCFGRKRPRT